MSERRATLAAIGSALVAVAAYTAFAQEAAPDHSQDIAWMSAQQAYLGGLQAEDGWHWKPGGLRYRWLTYTGSNDHPTVAHTVTVHYEGRQIDGEVFDSSYARGEPATFPLGRLIKGWQVAIPEMGVGDTIEVAIPADLAYGPEGKGPIPGGATLVFKVELIAIGE
ncbi:MAG: FKBP-type peptidyl-prolyl cis-trans isomerase [Qipengyuania sp.]